MTERLDYTKLNNLYYKNEALKTHKPKWPFQFILLAYMHHMYTFVWKKSMTKHDKRLMEKIQKSIESINKTYHLNFKYDKDKLITVLEDLSSTYY